MHFQTFADLKNILSFALIELFIVVFSIHSIRLLRRNVASFSATVYRFHLQLIILIVIQVNKSKINSVLRR